MPSAKYRFPWREGNSYRLLVDGGAFLPAMEAAIRAARHYILLEMYLVESDRLTDRFLDAICRAGNRGVRTCLLLDDFGARLLRRTDRKALLGCGVELVFFNPLRPLRWLNNLKRDHRKLLLVDGEVAFTGGAGLAEVFLTSGGSSRGWHEVMVEIRGPVVADWHVLFAESWRLAGGGPLEIPVPVPAALPGGHPGRVSAHGSALGQRDIVRALLNHIRRAERRVWVATAYFLPSRKLRRALKRAARRGVDVRLLLPGERIDHPSVRRIGTRYYGRLLGAGVRIFEYRPRFLHLKLQLCDDWAAVGSSNLDRWNLRWNLEAAQELRDPKLLQQLEALFTADFAEAREISYRQWCRRPWYLRQLEQGWALVEAIARRLTRGRFPGPPL